MAESSQAERAAPEFRVRINGNYLPAETATDIKSIAIEEDLDTPGMFSFEMINWDMDRLRMLGRRR